MQVVQLEVLELGCWEYAELRLHAMKDDCVYLLARDSPRSILSSIRISKFDMVLKEGRFCHSLKIPFASTVYTFAYAYVRLGITGEASRIGFSWLLFSFSLWVSCSPSPLLSPLLSAAFSFL